MSTARLVLGSKLTIAVLMMACSVQSASAQESAITNADVVRLVAMHISDQTVIAVIHEATATRFALSELAVSYLAVSGVSTAVIATMRQSSIPTPVPNSQIAARPPTIAEAAAEAAKVKHEWSVLPGVSGGGGVEQSKSGGSALGDRVIDECRAVTNLHAWVESLPAKDKRWKLSVCNNVAERDARIQRINALVATYDQLGTLTPIAKLDRSNLLNELPAIKAELVQLSINIQFIAANAK